MTKRDLPYSFSGAEEPSLIGGASMPSTQQTTVIPAQDSLIADLLSLDLTPHPSGGGSHQPYAPAAFSSGLDDLLGLGSDGLVLLYYFIVPLSPI